MVERPDGCGWPIFLFPGAHPAGNLTPLAKQLKARITSCGPMTVDAWMETCLADPEHGYYISHDPFGRQGDFTTAPEISQMFGELLGLWAGVVWQQIGAPKGLRIIEFGPGRGTLMADFLRAAARVDGLLSCAQVHLVEISPILRQRQQQALSEAPVSISWHDKLADIPHGPTILIGNEFLDALPIRQAIKDGGHWRERTVDWHADKFVFSLGAEVGTQRVPSRLQNAAEGSIFEDCPVMKEVASEIAGRMAGVPGAALFIDYGYGETAVGETLQAVRGHAFVDPLSAPGEVDLTAHVDFSALAEVARDAGLMPLGPVPQGDFLERLGLSARAQMLLARATPAQALDIATARTRLVGENAMGRLFKVMALTACDIVEPPGFRDVPWAPQQGLS